jgi:hypothetical protein
MAILDYPERRVRCRTGQQVLALGKTLRDFFDSKLLQRRIRIRIRIRGRRRRRNRESIQTDCGQTKDSLAHVLQQKKP